MNPIENLEEILATTSQVLSLEEFQTLDLDIHMMKTPEQLNKEKKVSSHKSSSRKYSGSLENTKPDSRIQVKKFSPKLYTHRRSSLKLKSSENLRSHSNLADMMRTYTEEELGKKRSSWEFSTKSSESFELKLTDKENTEEKLPYITENPIETDSASDICRKKECLDSKIRLPPIRQSESGQVLWDLRGICEPLNFNTKSVESIHRVNLRRKEKHDNIIKEMSARMAELNETIEKDFRSQAQHVNSNIHLIKNNVERILGGMFEKPSIRLSKKLIDRMQEIIHQLNENRLQKIEAFCNFVRKLERQRSENFKGILSKAYKEMHENMFLLPFEIQVFFEKKIQHLNQITMNNYHCYAELEGKLKILVEEELKMWFQKVKLYETMNEKLECPDRGPNQTSTEAGDVEETMDFKKNIMSKLEEAEKDLRRMKNNIKYIYPKLPPTLEVFENFLEEIENTATCLIQTGLLKEEGAKLGRQAMQDLSNMSCVDEQELEKLWSEGVQNLLQTLNDNLKSFSHSTRIFDDFCERNEDWKVLYEQQLFLLITKNDRSTMRINYKMNLLIDTLRQEATEEGLKKTFDQIKNTIASIDAVIQSHLKDEINLVDKFVQLCQTNADLLIDEISRFIKQFVPPPDADPRIMKKRASWMAVDELKTNDHLFSKDFLTCKYMMQAIDNWQFGVWHALMTIMETLKDVITENLTSWANEEKKILCDRSDLKSRMNNVRIHCIEEDFYKLRQAELYIHSVRFEKHEMGVKESISNLHQLKVNMETVCKKYITDSVEGLISEAMKDSNGVKKKRHAQTILNRLFFFHSQTIQDIKPHHELFTEAYSGILLDLRNSHLKFLQSILFFNENGNFAIEEAKQLVKKVVAMEKILAKEFANNKDIKESVLKNFTEDCRIKLEMPIQSLNKMLEEFTFKEKVEQRMKHFHSTITNAIFDFKYKFKSLGAKIRTLCHASYSTENLGSYDWLFSFSKYFKDILIEIGSLKGNLHYNEAYELEEKFFGSKFDLSQLSLNQRAKRSSEVSRTTTSEDIEARSKKNDKKRTFKGSTILMKNKNFSHLLYASPPREDGSFLTMLQCKVFSAFSDVQEFAIVFYDSHVDISPQVRIPAEYKAFIEEIFPKFKYYQLQLEFFWLECVADFTNMVSGFRNFLDNYYLDTLTKYFDSRKEKLVATYKITMKNLGDNLKCVNEYFMTIHEKLKPMFGHPGMTRMLTIVDAYMDQADDFSKRALLDNLEPSKETLKTHCVNTESIFLDMEKILACIKNSTGLMIIIKELQEKLIVKTRRMQKILSLENEHLHQKNIGTNVKKKLKDFVKKADIPIDVKISSSTIEYSDKLPVDYSSSLDIEEMITSNQKEYESYAEEIESFRGKCAENHEKYRAMWKQDIDKILKLYQVKYDTPNFE